ncbi:hypothetical protein CL652_02120 [bacterium]|nr:hypothetical protein [bacterium]|tara:strand:+ start:28124 stop:28540 length:417 start_codon:yes stop_codon:yes gene_type:complete
MKVIVTALALFLLWRTGAPAQAGGDAVCSGPACVEMRTAGPERLVPTRIELVCIYFEQRQSGPVVLTIFGSGGAVIRRISKQAGTKGRFCIGKSAWVSRATRLELCNREDTRAATGETLRTLVLRGGTPESRPVRLVP